MAVNIIFWSREAKFSGFPNGKNHTYNISHYFIYKNQYSLPFIGSVRKGSEFQVNEKSVAIPTETQNTNILFPVKNGSEY